MSLEMTGIDIVGDIHGELGALKALGRELGYDVDREDWPHPEGRRLIFLGDLIDRGAHSLQVAQLVHTLCRRGRAACIMGNHEYNLVAHHLKVAGYEKPKHSNGDTIKETVERAAEWQPVLELFRDLPIALELSELRIIHACWHSPSVALVQPHLGPHDARHGRATSWASEYVALQSPFERTGLDPRLASAAKDEDDAPHAILMKGYEEPAAETFHDSDGAPRSRVRATWWQRDDAPVLRDKTLVVGHYWNLPPIDGTFCPPHPSGHPLLKEWLTKTAVRVPDRGDEPCDADVVCVDFNGLTACSDRACVGAFRWPERRVVWATSAKTRRT